jgi:hypothetical protein
LTLQQATVSLAVSAYQVAWEHLGLGPMPIVLYVPPEGAHPDDRTRVREAAWTELRARDLAEVPSSVIGDLAMDKLRQLDQVAYIRFASVYRAFADISSFEDELRRLIDRGGQVSDGERASSAARSAAQ